MAVVVAIEEQVESAIAFLREAGREAEARAVEALLDARVPARRRRSFSDDNERVPLGEAARLLGTSRKGVLRRIESGLLVGESDAHGSYCSVSRRSLSDLLDQIRAFEIVAAPLGDMERTGWNGNSQVGRMIEEGVRELEDLERREMEEEASDDDKRTPR